MILVWRNIHIPTLLRFLIPALVGIPIGLQLLSHISSSLLTILIAFFLITYGGFFTFKTHLPNLTRDTPVLDSVVGLIGGVLGLLPGYQAHYPPCYVPCAHGPK